MPTSQKPQVAAARDRLRTLMPVAQKWAYMDHAAVAPLPAPTRTAIARWLDQATTEGDAVWPEWARRVAKLRTSAANMLGADDDEIALVGSTTQGINFVAEGLDWRSGDNVVTLDDEFPSNLYPWMHLADRGVETRLTPTRNGVVDYDQLESMCDERTRLVAISWVGYANGCRRDLRAVSDIAKRRDAFLMVDAIQGLGVFPLDVRDVPIDVLAADGHKWMLGPEGAGLAYIRRELLPRLRPIGIGWNSVVQGSDFSHIELRLRESAARYEGGSKNMAGLIGLGASVDLLMSLGIENIAEAILDITDRACDQLADMGFRVVSPRSGSERSGIVSIEMPGVDVAELRRHCLARHVALAYRDGRLRVSAHAYNNEEDLMKLTNAIRDFGLG